MAGVFISYRREDTIAYAGRLYDRLCSRFGKEHTFMDIDTLRPGDDFIDVLQKTVATCSVLIAVIGRNWLTIKDESGKPRLWNPEDFVNLEVSVALKRGVRVIPVLVGGAQMPEASELPAALQSLARKQAVVITDIGFDDSVSRLLEAVRLSVKEPEIRHSLSQLVTGPGISQRMRQNPVLLGTLVLFAVASLSLGSFLLEWPISMSFGSPIEPPSPPPQLIVDRPDSDLVEHPFSIRQEGDQWGLIYELAGTYHLRQSDVEVNLAPSVITRTTANGGSMRLKSLQLGICWALPGGGWDIYPHDSLPQTTLSLDNALIDIGGSVPIPQRSFRLPLVPNFDPTDQWLCAMLWNNTGGNFPAHADNRQTLVP